MGPQVVLLGLRAILCGAYRLKRESSRRPRHTVFPLARTIPRLCALKLEKPCACTGARPQGSCMVAKLMPTPSATCAGHPEKVEDVRRLCTLPRSIRDDEPARKVLKAGPCALGTGAGPRDGCQQRHRERGVRCRIRRGGGGDRHDCTCRQGSGTAAPCHMGHLECGPIAQGDDARRP